MSIRFEIKADLSKLQSWVNWVGGKQIPYATARTLTELAGEVNRAAVKDLRKYFTLRNKYVIRSFRKTMADKRDYPHCYSVAGSVAPFMELQVSGGKKLGQGGSWLGVPKARGELLKARPTDGAKIPRPLWVNQLLSRKGYLMISGNNASPILLKQTRSGKYKRRRSSPRSMPLVHRERPHTGKRGWKRETLYVMKKEVQIPARFPFEEIAQKTIAENFEEIFIKNLEESLK